MMSYDVRPVRYETDLWSYDVNNQMEAFPLWGKGQWRDSAPLIELTKSAIDIISQSYPDILTREFIVGNYPLETGGQATTVVDGFHLNQTFIAGIDWDVLSAENNEGLIELGVSPRSIVQHLGDDLLHEDGHHKTVYTLGLASLDGNQGTSFLNYANRVQSTELAHYYLTQLQESGVDLTDSSDVQETIAEDFRTQNQPAPSPPNFVTYEYDLEFPDKANERVAMLGLWMNEAWLSAKHTARPHNRLITYQHHCPRCHRKYRKAKK